MLTYLDHTIMQDEIFPGVPFTVIQTPGKAMVHFTTIVNSGFNLAPKDKYELPHLLEHLAFEGNTTYPEGKAMSIELETAGVYHNAATNSEFNWYDFSGPHTSLELMQKHVIAQLYTPLFTEKAIAQQKQVISNELHRKREEDGYRVWENITQALWPDVTPTIDERIAKLPSIARQDILDFYAQFYHLQNLHFVVCGDIPDIAIKKMKATFQAGLKKAPQSTHTAYQPKQKRVSKKNILISEATAQDVSTFELRFYVPYLDDESLATRRVLRSYLAGGLGSVMQRELREAGLTYTITAFWTNQSENSGFGFADKVPHKNLVPLLQKCFAYVQAVADGKIDKVAFARAKGMIKNSQEASLQRSSDFLNWYFDELRHRRELQSPAEYYTELNAVTTEDMQKVAKKYLSGKDSHWLLSVVTQAEDITEENLLAELDGA